MFVSWSVFEGWFFFFWWHHKKTQIMWSKSFELGLNLKWHDMLQCSCDSCCITQGDIAQNKNGFILHDLEATKKTWTPLLCNSTFIIHEGIQQRRYLVSQQVSSDCLLVYGCPSHFDGCAIHQENTYIQRSLKWNWKTWSQCWSQISQVEGDCLL